MDYTTYLQLNELLSLQNPMSDFKREEYIFIITHQVTELWLKSLLLEIDFLKNKLKQGHMIDIISSLKRCQIFWDLMIQQFSALKALSLSEFMLFRPALKKASGAQSIQYKVLEATLGICELRTNTETVIKLDRDLISHLQEESLKKLAYVFLHNTVKENFPNLACDTMENFIIRLKDLYINCKEVAFFIDNLVEFDEAFIRWKQEHLYVVKRMIGQKLGTASSSSHELAEKLKQPIFAELWELRNQL